MVMQELHSKLEYLNMENYECRLPELNEAYPAEFLGPNRDVRPGAG